MLPDDSKKNPLTKLHNLQKTYSRSLGRLKSTIGDDAYFLFIIAVHNNRADHVRKVLFPFLNSNGVRVGICGFGTQWRWTFGYCLPCKDHPYASREEAEAAAFKAALQKLEESF
jgi:hypothetical protein